MLNQQSLRGSKEDRNTFSKEGALIHANGALFTESPETWPRWGISQTKHSLRAFISRALSATGPAGVGEALKTFCPAPGQLLTGGAAIGSWSDCFLLGQPMLLQTEPAALKLPRSWVSLRGLWIVFIPCALSPLALILSYIHGPACRRTGW